MRVLVTAGAGFIGSHASERLLRDGHDVIIVDDLNNFYSPDLKRMNLCNIQKSGAARFYWVTFATKDS
jgi:nucleoside-diphosphate-sugar epimerase